MFVQFNDVTHLGPTGDLAGIPKAQFSTPGTNSMNQQIRAGNRGAAAFGAYGTGNTSDTLAAWRVANSVIADYGLDLAFEGIKQLLEAHNKITADLLTDFCDITTDRQRRFGNASTMMQMMDVDQGGLPVAQKLTAGVTVGFPMTRKAIGLQWTADFFTQATTVELAGQMEALLTADTRRIQLDIKKALFTPTNTTFYDQLVDNAVLLVKALVNADTSSQNGMPPGPNGEVFTAATHTHFMYPGSGNGDSGSGSYSGIPSYATKSFTGQSGVLAWNNGANAAQMAYDVQCLQDNVTEHHNGGRGKVFANRTEEVALKSMPGFTAVIDEAHVIANIVTDRSPGQLDVLNLFNRLIGWYRGFEVWIKPWMPSGYLFAFLADAAEFAPPLCVRVPVSSPMGGSVGGGASLGGGDLRQVNPLGPVFPMYAQAMDRRYGIGVWNRVNGAAMSVYSIASYTAPTFSYP